MNVGTLEQFLEQAKSLFLLRFTPFCSNVPLFS